jgi:hypothetical protein
MPIKFNQVYQFKITLKGLELLIWRQIQVPDVYSFWDLHVAIQDAMSWLERQRLIFASYRNYLWEAVSRLLLTNYTTSYRMSS